MKARLVLVMAICLMLLQLPSAHAASCTSADPTCACGDDVEGGGTVVLPADLSCSTGPALNLRTNTTLDLNGHSITCTGTCTNSVNDVGIEFIGSNATVRGPGLIDNFAVGVDGNSLSSTTAEKLIILNSYSAGIKYIENAKANLVTAPDQCCTKCIYLDDTAKLIQDNLVASCGQGIYMDADTTTNLKLDSNSLVGNSIGLYMLAGAACNENSSYTKHNVIVGNGTADVLGRTTCELDFSKNICLIPHGSGNTDCAETPFLTGWSAFLP